MGNPKDSLWGDWGTLGNIGEHWGITTPPLRIPFVLGVGEFPYIGCIQTAYIGEDSSILGT